MRFQVLTQTAKGVAADDADMRSWVIETLERAKWHLWHGHRLRAGELLEDLHGWTEATRSVTPLVSKLRRGLGDFRRFLHQIGIAAVLRRPGPLPDTDLDGDDGIHGGSGDQPSNGQAPAMR
jgi:hypothetical protein